jgi:hypothetical protein
MQPNRVEQRSFDLMQSANEMKQSSNGLENRWDEVEERFFGGEVRSDGSGDRMREALAPAISSLHAVPTGGHQRDQMDYSRATVWLRGACARDSRTAAGCTVTSRAHHTSRAT